MGDIPRGIRNHNPGNVEKGDPWQGLARDQSADDRFCVFKGPEWGIRAIGRILIAYQDKYDLGTIEEMLHRWAPPVENDTGSYVDHVAALCGVAPDDLVDVTDFAIAEPLVRAIITHENGMQPYADGVIQRGLELAGLEIPAPDQARALDAERPMSESRTMRGGKVAAAGGSFAVLAGAVAELETALPVLRQVAGFIEGQSGLSVAVLGGVTLASVGYMIHARIDDRETGKR